MQTSIEKSAKPLPERSDVTGETFKEDIYPSAQPVVMRGFVKDWQTVKAARQSPTAVIDYLKDLDSGRNVDILVGPEHIKGRFFYREDMSGPNFERTNLPFHAFLDRLKAGDQNAIYLQSTPVDQFLPQFLKSHTLSIMPPQIMPRLWIGNELQVQTHFDLSQNVACVLAGRRQFTLYPPDQTPNLYMGPIERTLAGTPVSMVDADHPDYDRFPNFKLAEDAAMTAVLEPGDAIFIPYLWWHRVQSLEPVNILMNYWWNGYDGLGSPMYTLLHAILSLRDMPPPMKDAWKVMFDTFVFADDLSASEHIPPQARGGLGPMSNNQRAELWRSLAGGLSSFAARFGPPPRS